MKRTDLKVGDDLVRAARVAGGRQTAMATELRAYEADLLCSIERGGVWTWTVAPERSVFDRAGQTVTHIWRKLDELRLVTFGPAAGPKTPVTLTDAGRAWLAIHGGGDRG